MTNNAWNTSSEEEESKDSGCNLGSGSSEDENEESSQLAQSEKSKQQGEEAKEAEEEEEKEGKSRMTDILNKIEYIVRVIMMG